MRRWSRGRLVAALLVPVVVAVGLVTVVAAGGDHDKRTVVPRPWAQEVGWDPERTVTGDDVVLGWRADAAAEVDPGALLGELQRLYGVDVDEVGVASADGMLAGRRVVVVVDPGLPEQGWAAQVVDGTALLRIDDALTQVPSTGLARAVGDLLLRVAVADAIADRPTPGDVPVAPADAFWQGTVALLGAAGVPSAEEPPLGQDAMRDLVRAPALRWSSPRQGEGSAALLQYLVDRDGVQVLGRLWQQAAGDGEARSPLEAYSEVSGLSQAGLHRRLTEYAMRTVAWDLSEQDRLATAAARLDPLVAATRSTPVEVVDAAAGHYRVTSTWAPAEYGFTVVRLEADTPAATVRLRLRGHVGAGPDAGWSFGFVALHDGLARYSPVTEAVDGEVEFRSAAGDDALYLVVVGTPVAAPARTAADGWSASVRYPYDFRLAGARVHEPLGDGTEEGPLPDGVHRHANGGGLVDDTASVAATVHVGPQAVVRGSARLTGRVRIEGRAWVQDGARLSGSAMVRDYAVVGSAAVLGGDVVVGGDAVVDFTCDAGSYLDDVDRACDGRDGPGPRRVPSTGFSTAEMAISTEATGSPPVPTPAPTPTPTGSPSPAPSPSSATGSPSSPPSAPEPAPSPSASASRAPQPGSSPTRGGVEPPEPEPAGDCVAVYTVTTAWPGAYQAQVVVTAGSEPLTGWRVMWTLPKGLTVNQVWSAQVGTSGSTVTAENVEWNGRVEPGGEVTFGFQGSATSDRAAERVPSLTCTRTR